MPFPPTFDRAWDETFPPDTQAANLLGQDIRNFKADIRERVALLSGTLANRPSNMDAVFGGANNGILYFATDTGQMFQWGGSAWADITANFLGISAPNGLGPDRVVASANFQLSAALGSTLLYNVPAALSGAYLLSLYSVCIATNGAGRSYPFTLTYTDDFGAQSAVSLGSAGTITLSANTAGSTTNGDGLIYCVGGTTINYSFAANGAGTGTMSVRIRLLYLG